MAEYDDRYDDRDDDRPRRPRKKGNTALIVMLVVGGILLVCGGGCAIGGYFYVKGVMDVIKAPDEFLAKVRTGDYQGAYNSTSGGFKARYTLQQFTDAMKGAKLDQNNGQSGQPTNSSSGNTITLNTTVSVPGKTVPVAFKLVQQGGPFDFVIDDITGPDISYTGPAKK